MSYNWQAFDAKEKEKKEQQKALKEFLKKQNEDQKTRWVRYSMFTRLKTPIETKSIHFYYDL